MEPESVGIGRFGTKSDFAAGFGAAVVLVATALNQTEEWIGTPSWLTLWIRIPLFAVLIVAFMVSLSQLFHRRKTAVRMAEALEARASELFEDGKYPAVLKIRDGVSDILHAEGLHQHRNSIGHTSLRAAEHLGQVGAQVSILLDDLGWATFRQGKQQEAERRIEDGLKRCAVQIEAGNRVPFLLYKEKGLRHQAFMAASPHPEKARARLNDAWQALDEVELEDGFDDRAKKYERAQLEHAEAYLTLASLKLEEGGTVERAGAESREKVNTALERVNRAIDLATELKALSNEIKYQTFKRRILEALGSEPESLTEVDDRKEELEKLTVWAETFGL